MARARFIRPEFFTDEKLSELPFGARLLFAGIWCHADLRGVFEHSAKLLRVQVFPFDEGTTSKQVAGWLDNLEQAGMIMRFTANGKEWGHVRKWRDHQSISTKEQQIGTKRPQPPGIDAGADPEKTGAATGKTQGQGQDVPEHDPGSDPDMSQGQGWNSTPTPTPTPTPAAAAADPRLTAVAAAGGYLDFKDQDLRPDWLVAIGEHPVQRIAEVMAYGRHATQKPVRMPSAYCEHTKSMLEAHRKRVALLRAESEASHRQQQERAESSEKTKLAEAAAARNRATVGGILATYDDDPTRWAQEITERQARLLADLRTAYDARRPLGLLAFHLDGLPRVLAEAGTARGREIAEQTEVAV